MTRGLTKDALAVLLTSVFLLWVVATTLGPISLHMYIGYEGWMRLAALDLIAAVSCFLGYILAGTRVPASMRVAPPFRVR